MAELWSFLPPLRRGYRWQLTAEGGRDCTEEYFGDCEAVEAKIFRGSALILTLTRTGDWDYWGPHGVDGDGHGLRKWAIEGPAPEGLMHWEQFYALGQLPHRIQLNP